jgi:four helix bundle protein
VIKRDLDERLLEYGARIVKLVESLPKTLAGKTIGDQLLRSGMSVGANYEEAQAAESRNDFIHKLQIALKELRESNYWLRLLAKAETLSSDRLTNIIEESNQLRAIFSKAIATAKTNKAK